MVLLRKLRTFWGISQTYLRGWRTRRRLVVIESDDWGAIRTSSREAYDELLGKGYAMDRAPYAADALETTEDMERLLETLESVRDSTGHPACMTANMIVGNPDFARIRDADFNEYFHEKCTETLARDTARREAPELWMRGHRSGTFVPQLHARGHICWWQWLAACREGRQEAMETFDLGMAGVPEAASPTGTSFYGPQYVGLQELQAAGADIEAMVLDAAGMFEEIFGYVSSSVIAPNYTWTDEIEKLWARGGIRYIQGTSFQRVGMHSRRPHYLGQQGAAGGLYLIRNCFLEPLLDQDDRRCVRNCLRQVQRAFRWHKPAVIGSHRVNYIGSIIPENRRRGLRLLRELLEEILHRWPDVEFVSTPRLGEIVEAG